MLHIDSVVGSRLEADLHERLHHLEHHGAVDELTLATEDMARRRLRATTRGGTELTIALPRDQKLYDGAVLVLEPGRAIVVRAKAERWLRLAPRSIADALALGYHAGNLHWRVRFEGEAVLVALEAPVEQYTTRLGELMEDRRVAASVVSGEEAALSAAAGLLAAVWQADTAFPSGAFAFSNGLEGAVALGSADGREGFAALVEMHLKHRWRSADRVALVHAYRAAGVVDRLAAIDAAVEAATLVEALRTGSRRQGAALVAAHARMGTAGAADLQAAVRAGRMLGHLAVVQGALWRAAGLSEEAAVAVSAYTAVQGLATASVRLGRIGIVEAQAVVAESFATITPLAALAVADDESIGSFATLLDVAAARHGTADVRLFSN